jgi:hypothetical protein
VTHNSLEANQCPHISLIDRRHFDYAAFPIGPVDWHARSAYVKRRGVARPLTALSHINVRVLPRGARGVAAKRNASGNNDGMGSSRSFNGIVVPS